MALTLLAANREKNEMRKVTQGAHSLRDCKHWQHTAQEADTDKSFPLMRIYFL